MSDFNTSATDTLPLAPNKRVNYTFGMILGEDDFQQEQSHFEWKHCLSNRLLHGYGTVCGLKVTSEPLADSEEVEIRVLAGTAISPQGKWIWVERNQCARLNAWLQRDQSEHDHVLAPGAHTVYVQLCYVECPTDLVPIVGEPCVIEDDTQAASRILEAFRVEFVWTPPEQSLETHVRSFGDLLAQVDILPEMSPPVGVDERERFLNAVRQIDKIMSPPLASPFDGGPFHLAAATVSETLRQALAIWATEVCPRFESSGEADCILLACLDFEIDDNGQLVADSVNVDNCTRPILVANRLKQELFGLLGRPAYTSVPMPPEAQALPTALAAAEPAASRDVATELAPPTLRELPTPEARLLPFATLTRLDARVYEIWFNIRTFDNRVAVESLDENALTVQMETEIGPGFLRRIGIEAPGIQRRRRNVFVVNLAVESDVLRFTFSLSGIFLTDGTSLSTYTAQEGVTFVGYDGGDLVTMFVRGRVSAE